VCRSGKPNRIYRKKRWRQQFQDRWEVARAVEERVTPSEAIFLVLRYISTSIVRSSWVCLTQRLLRCFLFSARCSQALEQSKVLLQSRHGFFAQSTGKFHRWVLLLRSSRGIRGEDLRLPWLLQQLRSLAWKQLPLVVPLQFFVHLCSWIGFDLMIINSL